MSNRDRIIQILTTALTIALSVLAARFGIPFPPIQVPPSIHVPPPVVNVLPAHPVPPPVPQPTPQPGVVPPSIPATPPTVTPKVDPKGATVKLIANGHYCTATVIGPRQADGTQWVLTAAHCVTDIGEVQRIVFRSGTSVAVEVVSISPDPDFAWMKTAASANEYPYTLLYPTGLVSGQPVYHSGYGVHKPGNTERGKVDGPTGESGRYHFNLSVSHGDSGSGIIDAKTGLVVGVVSTGSGRDPSPWTNGPAVPVLTLPSGIADTPPVIPACPGGRCPVR